jgi:alpha-amylase
MTPGDEPTRLVLVVHNHQPVGNFDFILEKAVDRAYAPLVDLLGEHERVRVGLHFTGCLLEWLESHRPSLLAAVRELCRRGQVEILGGGWAEPMLAILPDRDALGQIRMMRGECARLFGATPRGMWLAERVWDPDLPRLLCAAGVEYTLLDDTHFRRAGLLAPRLAGHFVTEKAGDSVAVFPIDRELRYAIPFSEPDRALDAIRSVGPGKTVTYGDDGEKFGIWPETHEWVWGKGWLERFFEALTRPDGQIELLLPCEQLDRYPATGRVYLPTASYHEMGEWALSAQAGRRLLDLKAELKRCGLAEAAEPFVHGGIWTGFLAKYPEASLLHRHMLRASEKVARKARDADANGVAPARRALYRGQCNCPYWHGLFGGLYLPHLRHAVYRELLRAEALVDDVEGVRIDTADLDGDLRDEIALESAAAAVWISPALGGQALVLDDRKRRVALGHVLTRRPETYHRELLWDAAPEPEAAAAEAPRSIHDLARSKVPGIKERLVYDAYDRRIFVDHLLPEGARLEAIEGPTYEPLADLTRLGYRVRGVEQEAGRGRVVLEGEAPLVSGPGSVRVVKTVSMMAPSTIEVDYEVSLDADLPVQATFGVESGLALVQGEPDVFSVQVLDPREPQQAAPPTERGTWSAARSIAVRSGLAGATVVMTVEPEAAVWRLPIETVSQSEDGAELVYQGTVFAFCWPVELTPGAPVRRKLVLSLD